MKQISLSKVAVAATTFTCAALLSFGWPVDSAQARHVSYGKTGSTGAATARTAAYQGGARYGRGPNNLGGLVGGDDAGTPGMGFGRASYGRTGSTGTYRVGYGAGAAAVGTAAAIGATSPGWGGGPYYTGAGYYGPGYNYGGGPNNLGGLVGGDDSGTYASRRWGWGGGPYYGARPYGGPMSANAFGGPVGWWGGVNSNDHTQYMKNLRDSGYDPKNDFNANGTIRTQ